MGISALIVQIYRYIYKLVLSTSSVVTAFILPIRILGGDLVSRIDTLFLPHKGI